MFQLNDNKRRIHHRFDLIIFFNLDCGVGGPQVASLPSPCEVTMSQKSQSDQKHFAVGRGLLAAAETLNFSRGEQQQQRSSCWSYGGVSSGVGGVSGAGGGSGGHPLGNTMKLFASLGLSPSDLDALAQIPEEDISVETLPRILNQLKSRKEEHRGGSAGGGGGGSGGGAGAGGNSWIGASSSSGPQGSGRLPHSSSSSSDFGFPSVQDMGPHGFYGGGGRERAFPCDMSRHNSYGGLGLSPPSHSSTYRVGSPSNGKVQDYLGVTPAMFPHVCSLCDFDVHSVLVSRTHFLLSSLFLLSHFLLMYPPPFLGKGSHLSLITHSFSMAMHTYLHTERAMSPFIQSKMAYTVILEMIEKENQLQLTDISYWLRALALQWAVGIVTGEKTPSKNKKSMSD